MSETNDIETRAAIYAAIRKARENLLNLEMEAIDRMPDFSMVQTYATIVAETASRVVVLVEERMPNDRNADQSALSAGRIARDAAQAAPPLANLL